jgi:hypothetical protein
MNWRYGIVVAALVLVLAASALAHRAFGFETVVGGITGIAERAGDLEQRVAGSDSPTRPQTSRTSIGLTCCGLSYPIWNTNRDRSFDFSELRALGVKFIRVDYLYGNALWQAEAERLASLGSSHGMATTVIVGGWMNYADRPSLAEFETFARDTATKLSAVDVFEVINEPDLVGWTPETYVAYLEAAYRGIKAARPEAVVSTGGISRFGCAASPCPTGTGMVDWVRRMYEAGAAPYFDALALHLYDDPLDRGAENVWDWAFVEPTNVRGVMDANGDRNTPLWSSENGAPIPKYTLEEQAQIVGNAIRAVKDQTFPLANVTHYTLQDDDVVGFGLLDPANARRPAWLAYRDAMQR